MRTEITPVSFVLKCLDQRQVELLVIEKKKNLIGSSEKCDFIITDKSISSLHAFLVVKKEGCLIKDLFSEAGIFLNGSRVEEANVFPGDTLTFGTLSFVLMEQEQSVVVIDPDKAIDSVALSNFVTLPLSEGLTFIDGEYCDITFNESLFKPLSSIPLAQDYTGYIELDETQPSFDIVLPIKDKRLEVISYVNGFMMDVTYKDLIEGDYYLNSTKDSKRDILFYTLKKTRIFSIQDGKLSFYPCDEILPSVAWEDINLSSPLFLSHGTEQISLRLVDHATGWIGIPAFYRDRDFFKQGSKVFAGVFLPLLLLLFITVPKNDDVEKEIAVVYKLPEKIQKPTDAQEKSDLKAQELTSKNENTGHKENDRPDKKVEFSQASQNQKVVAKSSAPAAAAARPVETAPVKSYEFKSSVALNSLVGDAPKLNTKGSNTKSDITEASFNAGSSDTGALVAGADIGVSRFNGSDKKGSGAASYGSRGLAAKSGFDSSYLEPKTVVLGSMDPELLRKILREYIPQFRHCYQQELIGHSEKVKGVIDLNFTISAGGKVSKYNIKIKDAQFSPKGVGCMGSVLSLIDFPKPKGGGVVDVRQPLNFLSETEKI